LSRKQLAILAGIAGIFLLGVGVCILVTRFQSVLDRGEGKLQALLPKGFSLLGNDGLYFPFVSHENVPTDDQGEDNDAQTKADSDQPVEDLVHENTFSPFIARGQEGMVRVTPAQEGKQRQPFTVRFKPGETCGLGEETVCTNLVWDNWVELITVSSGVSDRSEPLRAAVEGVGAWGLAADSLKEIQRNMGALEGAAVTLEGNGQTRDDMRIRAVARVPSDRVLEYFSLPFNDAVAAAAQYNKSLGDALDNGRDSVILEFSGWQVRDEPLGPGTTPTNASVYLIVLQIP